MEDGHGVLLLIVVEFLMNLEEKPVSLSLPAGKQEDTVRFSSPQIETDPLNSLNKNYVF